MANRKHFAELGVDFRRIERGDLAMEADMGVYFNQKRLGDIVSAGDLYGTCGSRCCIAGLSIIKFSPTRKLNLHDWTGDTQKGRGAFTTARDLLGLTEEEAEIVFLSSRWSESMDNKYLENHAGTMALVCERIANGMSPEEAVR